MSSMTVSAFGDSLNIYREVGSSGNFKGQHTFERWLQDPQGDSLEKARRATLIGESLRAYHWKAPVSWLKDPDVPLLKKVALVFALVVASAICFALAAMAKPMVPALCCAAMAPLLGTAYLFLDLRTRSVADVEANQHQHLLSLEAMVEKLGGIEAYYHLPVFPKQDLWMPIDPQDLPASVVRGLDTCNHPFIALKLRDKESGDRPFSLVLKLGFQPKTGLPRPKWYYDADTSSANHNMAYRKEREDILNSPIPEEDVQRYLRELGNPKKDFPGLDKVLYGTFPSMSQDHLLAAVHQIVVEKNHPRFQLVEAQ